MEISGLDPEITICKIDVLPIKLYPPPLTTIDKITTIIIKVNTKTLVFISFMIQIVIYILAKYIYPNNDFKV